MKKWLAFALGLCLCSPAQAAVVKVEKGSGGWRLQVDGAPYFVKGVSYNITTVGETPDEGTWRDWMIMDDDQDGRIDVAYQSWVDRNRNNHQDPDEKEIGDFQLLKEMGANTIRLYHHATSDPQLQALGKANAPLLAHAPNKAILRDLYEKYGIRVMVGDLLGAYTAGSGADWVQGTDYTNAEQKKNMLRSVEDMVKEFKDEPFLLMWALGNENNYGESTHTNADKEPIAYAGFVNEVAQRIHQMDPDHPVVLVNGETRFLDVYAQYAPQVDIIGVNCYRNAPGFGRLFRDVAAKIDKPLLLSEYGTPSPKVVNNELDEIQQMEGHLAVWREIRDHAAGKTAPGNSIGGFAFEWLDTWCRNWAPSDQNVSEDGWNAEWHGLTSQGDGQNSPLMRQLRHVYYVYQELWNEEK